ncbi:MAG: hypothetical protein EOL95_10160 [Bacteroidia bacterium]|nr:hypothetical protein [Bacteroidia bacterium]
MAASGVLVNVYDLQNQKVYPSEVVLVNENVVKLVFEEPVQGYCVVISVGSPAFIEIITSAKLKFYYNNDLKYETPIKDIYEDDDYLYISCTIPVTEEFLINKIEILKSDNKVIFTSTCSDLFKSGEVEMNLQYRVSKGNI